MSKRAIEFKKVGKVKKLTNLCPFMSDNHNDVMVGSRVCLSCNCCKGSDKESVDCRYKRVWNKEVN